MSDWKFFVLGRGKSPLPNCSRCFDTAKSSHDPESCTCLTCHGFYAATSDERSLALMAERYPGHPWAVRTGAASGILVLDFEGPGSDPEGLNTLDRWEEYVGWSLPRTLTSGSPSGGRHLFYEYVVGTRSRNRVLPGCDIKAGGGYVLIPCDGVPGREWLTVMPPTPPTPEFRQWLASVRGGRFMSSNSSGDTGHAEGYDYQRFIRDGAPGGLRDEFFNDMIFRLRKAGIPVDRAYDLVRDAWSRCAQPDRPVNGVVAQWHMPWEHVMYKIRRIYATIEPDAVDESLKEWATTHGLPSSLADIAGRAAPREQGPRRIGRVTLA